MDKSLLKDEMLLMEALTQEGLDLDGLTPTEFGVVSKVLKEIRDSGDSSTMDKLYEVDFLRKPPTIEEFLTDPYYLGDICNPDSTSMDALKAAGLSLNDDPAKVAAVIQASGGVPGLFPKWRETLIKDLTPGNTVQQMIFTGGIGLGKSFVGSVVVLFKVAHALCLRNPLIYFGLTKTSSLVFSFFSVTQAQVKGGTFKDCTNILQESPFFRERIAAAKDRKYASRRIEMQGNIVIEAGSKVHEALGRNTLVSLIDEINFRLEKDGAASAYEMIEAIRRRTASRFSKDKHNPGLLIVISSTKNDTDFLVDYVKQQRSNPNARIYDYPWWELPGAVKWSYSGKIFRVDAGDNTTLPKILQDDEHCPAEREILVPVEHRPEFERDLTGSIRDVAGRTVGRTAKFFYDIVPLVNCIRDDIPNPASSEEIPISIGAPYAIKDFINPNTFLLRRGNQLMPLRHPLSPRFISMDMSMGGDAFGFAMIHPTHATEIGEFNPLTAIRQNIVKPCFEIDLLLRFVRDRGSKEMLDFGKIREFIWWLGREVGFQIEMISCDLLMLSAEMRGILQANGFETKYLSVDKTKEPYIQLRQAVAEGRLTTFDHEWFFAEAMHLENLPNKVDHPNKFGQIRIGGVIVRDAVGSKDLTDACAAALFCAQQSETPIQLNTAKAAGSFFKEFIQAQQNNPDSWLLVDAIPQDEVMIIE